MTAIAIVICSAVISAAIVAVVEASTSRSARPSVATSVAPLKLSAADPAQRGSHLTSTRGSGGPVAPTTARLIGQMLMTGMEGTTPDAQLLAEARAGEIGGVILFGANVTSALPSALRELQAAAREGHNPPLLVATDQEGGSVKRFPEGPPEVSTRAITTPTEAREQGRLTGEYLQAHGVNVDLAPVSDVSGSQDFERAQGRGFNGDAAQVSELATQFSSGLEEARVGATAKHFPGIGTLPRDTDAELQTVEEPLSVLRRRMQPFVHEVNSGVKLVMIANAIYPALDPTAPASMSRVVQQEVLRTELGFRGVIITDALDDPPQLPGSIGERAKFAAAAGASIVLLSNEQDGPPAFRALLDAVHRDGISTASVESAYSHVLALKRWLGR